MNRTLIQTLVLTALLIGSSALLPGCRSGGSGGPNGTQERIEGAWRVEQLEGTALGDVPGLREAPTLQVAADASISGFAGVNRFAGAVLSDGLAEGRFAPGPLAVTRMAGSVEAMDLETRYLGLLSAARRWRIEGGALLLVDGERELLRFGRVE